MKAMIRSVGMFLSATPLLVAAQLQQAQGEFINTDGEVIGSATLRQGAQGMVVQIDVNDLPAGPRAIHIHETGTCDDYQDGFQASGGHLNPQGREHGLLNAAGPDAGDLTNFYVHEDGYAWAEFYTQRASLDGSFGAQVLDHDGAALVIHEAADDHGSQPIGGAGDRIACAVIEER